MRLFSWITNRGNGVATRRDCDAQRLRHFSAEQSTIEPEWHSSWSPLDESDHYETRQHVGKSVEGFHGGVEMLYREGMGRIAWGEAHPTPEKAREAAGELEADRREEIEACSPEYDERITPAGLIELQKHRGTGL